MSKFELRDDEISGKRGFVLEHNGYDEGRGLCQRWGRAGKWKETVYQGSTLMGPIYWGIAKKCQIDFNL